MNLKDYKLVNLTDHPIVLHGEINKFIKPSGMVARVNDKVKKIGRGIFKKEVECITNLPNPKDGVIYIVSYRTMYASDRTDLAAPLTSKANKNMNGGVISVPGLIFKEEKERKKS